MSGDLNFIREGTPRESPFGLAQRSTRELNALRVHQIYARAVRTARFRAFVGKLLRRPARLADLEDVERLGRITARYSSGLQIVPVKDIRGSSGRSADFDVHFRPLNENTRDRWLSIATAMLGGTSLPPVDLVKLGAAYFVRDGNHRVSACRALKQDFIDAEVTVWQQAEARAQPVAEQPAIQPRLSGG